MFAGTAPLGDASTHGDNSLRLSLHNHGVPCSDESDQVAISATRILHQCKTLLHPYPFNTRDEVPKTLGELYTSVFYALVSRETRAVSASAGRKPAFSAGALSSVMADDERSREDVAEVHTDDDVAGKQVAVRSLDPQTYRREEAWITIFPVDKDQNPLRAVSRKHENDLLECVRANEYQYTAGLMTAASISSGELGSVNVGSMHANCGKSAFPRTAFF